MAAVDLKVLFLSAVGEPIRLDKEHVRHSAEVRILDGYLGNPE